MYRSAGLAALVVFACGGSDRPAPAPAGDDAGGAVAAPPALDLLAEVPADTPYLVAVVDAPPADGWNHLVTTLGPAIARLAPLAGDRIAAGTDDPTDRLGLALVAELAGTPLLRPRGVVYDLHGVRVIRFEAADRRGLDAALERAAERMGSGSWRQPGGGVRLLATSDDRGLYAAADRGTLVVAAAPTALLRPMLPVLHGDRPLPAPPLPAGEVDRLAAAHQLGRYAVGFVRPARVGERMRDAPETLGPAGAALAAAPGCRDALADLLTGLPQLVFGVRALTADHATLVAEAEVSPATAAALRQAQREVPGIPAALPDAALVGLAFSAADGEGPAAWRAPLLRVMWQCQAKAALAASWGPMSSVRAGALVVYGGTMHGFLPADLQGYLTLVTSRVDDLLAKAADYSVAAGGRPVDGGPFVRQPAGRTQGMVGVLQLARRGDSLVLAAGDQGLAGATEATTPAGPAPFVQLAVDIGRFVAFARDHDQPGDAASADAERVVDGNGLLGDAGVDVSGLVAHLGLVIEATDRGPALRVDLRLATPAATASPPPDPPSLAVLQCRRVVDRSWRQAAGALPLLDVTRELDEIERTYRTGADTVDFARHCLELDAAARACLLASADPIAATLRCPGLSSPYFDFDLPPLFSFFGPHPLDDLVPERGRPGPRLASEERFLVPGARIKRGIGWLVRDRSGCHAISSEGLVLDADCRFVDRGGGRWLEATAAVPCAPEPDGTCPQTWSYQVRKGRLVWPR